jgi:hypothetical protein
MQAQYSSCSRRHWYGAVCGRPAGDEALGLHHLDVETAGRVLGTVVITDQRGPGRTSMSIVDSGVVKPLARTTS